MYYQMSEVDGGSPSPIPFHRPPHETHFQRVALVEHANLSRNKVNSALVDLLIEKGIITEEEYEKRIKQRVKIK